MSVALTAGNFTILASNGGAEEFRAAQESVIGFGASLDAGQQAALFSALNTYLTAIGVV